MTAAGIGTMKNEVRRALWSWREQSRYIRELGPYFVASVLLMTTGLLFGVATSTDAPKLASARGEALAEFAKLFLGLSKPYLALAIFLNNGVKTLAVILVGGLGGILPFVFLLVNGYVLGIVLQASVQSKGWLAFFLAIVPHGLLELPAILMGTSIGLMLGLRAIKQIFGRGEKAIAVELARGLRFFLIIIVPLLLVSALIEAFITSSVVSK